MGSMAYQITSFTIVYPAVYSGADLIKYLSPASLAFVRRVHRGPVNSPHKWPVTRKMFPFNDVIMFTPGFLILIPIQIEIHFGVIQFPNVISQYIFYHVTTVVPLCLLQDIVVINVL